MGLICFDLDGVIADSSVAIPEGINVGLAAVGLGPLPAAELRRYIGPPLLDSFAQMLELAGLDPAGASACIEAYRAFYPEAAARLTLVYPGVVSMLDLLGESHRLAVVTSKPATFALPILTGLGLSERFEVVEAPELDELLEPKTETLRRALIRLGSARDSVIMVGDRHHDIEAGLANGAVTIGVLWGFGSRDELEGAGAHHLVEAPAELVEVVELVSGVAPA